MRSQLLINIAILLSAVVASTIMLRVSPVDNRVMGFVLWFLFFAALLWPARRAAARGLRI